MRNLIFDETSGNDYIPGFQLNSLNELLNEESQKALNDLIEEIDIDEKAAEAAANDFNFEN